MFKLAYAPDENYVGITIVSMLSVIENNPNAEIEFIILYSGLSQRAFDKFNWIKNFGNCKIRFIEVPRNQFKNFPTVNWVTTAAWFRTKIADLCPDCDKVLYLDSDTMVLAPLDEFFNLNLKDNYAAVVSTAGTNYLNLKSKSYFNSGVILINCKIWREEKVFEKIQNYVRANGKNIKCADQDVLNVICDLRKYNLPEEYNYCELYQNVEYKTMKNPKIVHFVGPNPNRFDCQHSLRWKWLEYAAKTPFFEEFINQNIYNLIRLYPKIKFDNFKYSILSKITFGKKQKHYLAKAATIKRLLSGLSF